uniref:Uncharacterized protein n=1 Tax=Periophthalmus magnuspinnatus TaxID=409849 RepID=A0A3B4B7E0_9GOBI
SSDFVNKQHYIEKFCLTRDRLVLHQQLACYQSFCAILNGKDILAYLLTIFFFIYDISVMTFGKGNKPVLCSASNDYLIVWDIESCQRRAREGKIPVGTVIGTLVGEVIHLSFSSADDKVAACTLDTVYVLNSKKQETISSLTGHLGSLTSAEFCSWNNNILVTTSEDRTFKVWDLQTESTVSVLGSPLISVIFLPETQQFCIGSLDGQVWCFSLTNVEKCHLVTKTDLQKVEKRFRILQESLGQQAGKDNTTEVSWNVLSWICIGSTNSLYMLDLATAELLTVLYFKGMWRYVLGKFVKFFQELIYCLCTFFFSLFLIDYPELSITMAGAYSTSVSQADNSVSTKQIYNRHLYNVSPYPLYYRAILHVF